MDLQRIRKHAFVWPWEDPRPAAQVRADVDARAMQAEANAIRRDRGLPEIQYQDPTAYTGRAITPEELAYQKYGPEWAIKQFEMGRKGGSVLSWPAYLYKQKHPSHDARLDEMGRHYLGTRKQDEIAKAIKEVEDRERATGQSVRQAIEEHDRWNKQMNAEDNPYLLPYVSTPSKDDRRWYHMFDRIDPDTKEILKSYWKPAYMLHDTPHPSTVNSRPDAHTRNTDGSEKTASVCNLGIVQEAMLKRAGLVGKADIQVHPEDELGNIVTLMKGIRGKWHGLNYRVPKGFESDGVSTPSFLWPIISPPVHPKTIRAGIIHDWLYRHQPKKWSREDADKLFADICREDGLSDIQTDLAYTGLRLFGGNAWDANLERKEQELAARKAARIAAKLSAKSKIEKAASL